jgi:two-component system, OmpR family, KDP operon response regulator KdpE
MSEKQKSLLIIDDEEDICEIVKAKFEQLGYKVLVAHSVHEGYQKLEKGAPDCVLLDICIPGGEGGLACLRGIRAYNHKNSHEQNRIRQTPVIMITGAGAVMQPIFEREAISGYIEKPFDLDNVQAKIEQAVWKR